MELKFSIETGIEIELELNFVMGTGIGIRIQKSELTSVLNMRHGTRQPTTTLSD